MPTTVVVISAIEATDGKRMSFYIVDCGLSFNDKEKMKKAFPPSNGRVTISFIELPDGSKGRQDPSWAKIDALGHLPIERALLHDSDILVRHDLWESCGIWICRGRCLRRQGMLGFRWAVKVFKEEDRTSTFNAGVMLIDLAEFRARLDSLVEFVGERPQTAYKDQDALNDFFHGEWQEIGAEWNATGLGTYA